MNLINSKKEIIRCIHEQDQQAEAWIDSVPMSIRDAFFDNPYVSARGRIIAYLMMYIFNEEEREWADWLLLEWTHNPELTIQIDGISYRFNSFDEGLDKLFELGLIKEDRKND